MKRQQGALTCKHEFTRPVSLHAMATGYIKSCRWCGRLLKYDGQEEET